MKQDWLDRTEYPFHSNNFHFDVHKMHYIDEGNGEIVLFVHGTPSWSFDFRHIVKYLSPHFRCVALDHIGFGLSDKPKNYDYSTPNHAKTLERFIAHLDTDGIHLVVHDFGGPIGLWYAMRHPEKVKSISIFNSWMWRTDTGPEWKKMKWFLKSPLLPFLYRQFNLSPAYLLPASFGTNKLNKSLLRNYTGPFLEKTERDGPIAFAKSLLIDQDWFESLWENKSKISQKPIQIIWGMRDPAIKPYNLQKFIQAFPFAQVEKYEHCGHFPQEEIPDQIAVILKAFLSSIP